MGLFKPSHVSPRSRRSRAVLDPGLCLGVAGPALVQRLSRQAELWIVRELWHILDNSYFYCRHPAALLSESAGEAQPRAAPGQPLAAGGEPSRPPADLASLGRTLRTWERLRVTTDLAGLELFWLGDGLSESLLPEGTPAAVHQAHERLVRSLDERLHPSTPLESARRDALALSMALGGVPVLAALDGGQLPGLLEWLPQGAAGCRGVRDEWAARLRADWHDALLTAHCAPMLWSGLRLALVYAYAPSVLSAWRDDSPALGELDEGAAFEDLSLSPDGDLHLYWCEL